MTFRRGEPFPNDFSQSLTITKGRGSSVALICAGGKLYPTRIQSLELTGTMKGNVPIPLILGKEELSS